MMNNEKIPGMNRTAGGKSVQEKASERGLKSPAPVKILKPKTVVRINAKLIDNNAREQIETMAKSPAFHGLISIMPDVHLGIGAVIGFTGKFNKCVIPNVVGVDIGCGVTTYPLGKIDIDFEALDKHIRSHVPLGFNSHKNEGHLQELTNKQSGYSKEQLDEVIALCFRIETEFYAGRFDRWTPPRMQIGTLGGGNHFIEVDVDDEGNKYLTVHSGSRNFGLKVATHFQKKAKEFCEALPTKDIATHLEYLPLSFGGEEYLKFLYIAQEYASLNRDIMITLVLKFFGLDFFKENKIESVHNYISPRDKVIRKGAISAHKGERVIIPLNMRDGIILGVGKGNPSYNNSAPHGAGRVSGRKAMKKKLEEGVITMEQFKDSMKGIFSTSVSKKTIDESPFAYKALKDIQKYLEETVEIEKRLKPVYNLKAN